MPAVLSHQCQNIVRRASVEYVRLIPRPFWALFPGRTPLGPRGVRPAGRGVRPAGFGYNRLFQGQGGTGIIPDDFWVHRGLF